MIEQASLIIGDGNWAVKSDALLGYKTINGKYYPREMTFTRATTGTRVNEAGLVELVPYNLLQRSNTFNNAIWQLIGTPTLTANYDTNPLTGENDAWRFQSSGGSQRIYQVLNNSFCTFSLYAKGSGIIRIQDSSSTHSTNLTLTSSWQRFLIYIPASFTNVQILSSTGGCDATIYGAQLVEGTEPLDYLPTTDRLDIPRIDYSTGSPALLLEPQRTNLILYSQDISNAAWTKSSGGTGSTPIVTANYTASPLEGKMADRVIFNLNGGTASADLSTLQSFSFNLTLGDNVTYYMAVKTNDGSTVNMTLNNNLGLSEVKSITPEWTIIKTSTTATSTSSGVLRLRLRGSEAVSDYADISVAYAQLEIGSYQTSYIPTTTASVTRNADVCVKTGISSLINSTEGVLYFEGSALSNDLTQRAISLSDGSNTNRVCLLYNDSSNAIRLFIQVGGSTQSSIISTSYTITDSNKIAIKWKENDFALWINGVEVGTDNSGVSFTSNTLNTLDFSFPNDTTFFYGNVKQVLTFNTALSDEELATLTTI